jgi:glycosyltransferase involved in cell wall biosynthesis
MEQVTIIIPVRNEEFFLKRCLDSVLKFEIPKNTEIKIFIIDGISNDNTLIIAKEYASKCGIVTVLRNQKVIQATAINIGLKKSKGNWIMRLDAHSEYPSNYLVLCLESALSSGADNTGGVFITEAGGPGYQAQIVQALTTHKFGVGDSAFRTGDKEGWADTVPYGFYRRKLFDQIGWLDERLVRAQDYEFNRRIIAAGGRIFRNPDIQIHYFNQSSLSAFYRKQFFKEAPYNAYMWYLAPYSFAWRHVITGIFSIGFLGGVTLGYFWPRLIGIPFLAVMVVYIVLAILASIQQAIRYKDPRHIFTLPVSFLLYHFIHGLGILTGIFRLATFTAPVQQIKEPWPGAGFYRVHIQRNVLKNNPKELKRDA